MGAVKNITIISIISAAVLGVFKKFTMGKKCFGIKVKKAFLEDEAKIDWFTF